MKRRTNKSITDEIKRLNRLIRKNNADKRNEVRQEKVKTLKEIAKLNKALKSKKVSPKQYSIQYKDLSKKLSATKKPKIRITKDDFKRGGGISREERYASIFKWNNSLARGIVGAFARGGKLDEIMGFSVGDYINTGENYTSILEKLRTDYSEEFYDLLDKYFIIGDYTFEDIILIMGQSRYSVLLAELFYELDKEQLYFNFDYFEDRLTNFMETIRRDYNSL